ncbi:hypothetical protein GcM1_c13315o25 [Golovinomyces cichoracearum]|uniref:Uncharacterized protein n=1 Tax=Golovinomyces cichoracearum TaxID=62708 RepID=A0A420IKQ7_9PEZI|nr:hypothetical protein GcM1_c13315o25 [Golovinomyces cichoracearum]
MANFLNTCMYWYTLMGQVLAYKTCVISEGNAIAIMLYSSRPCVFNQVEELKLKLQQIEGGFQNRNEN